MACAVTSGVHCHYLLRPSFHILLAGIYDIIPPPQGVMRCYKSRPVTLAGNRRLELLLPVPCVPRKPSQGQVRLPQRQGPQNAPFSCQVLFLQPWASQPTKVRTFYKLASPIQTPLEWILKVLE